MEVISYINISVSGFPFTKLISADIRHEPNVHGMAEIVGELEAQAAEDIVKRVDEKMYVEITTKAEGQPKELFCGCVRDLSMERQNEYCRVRLLLYSTSRLIDITKRKKTYQDTAKTYGQIITDSIGETADLHMMVSDKATGKLIMKYNETDWEFALRMAAQLNAPLIANLSSKRPQVYVGLPPAGRTITVESKAFGYGSDFASFSASSGLMPQDFSGEQAESFQYGYIGDCVSLNGRQEYIKSVHAFFVDGILHISYGLLGKASAGGGTASGLAVQAPPVSQASGRMMRGKVQAVEKDKVQVHITDVDEDYDSGGTWWFPYSTAYSSSDGSGWYCMPEVGDEVRVFFPSGNEGDAFVASSVSASPPSNPQHKSWKAPGGKEILLTDEGMYIIGKEGKIYLNLTDEKGVEIHSEKDISITSDANVKINSSGDVHVLAEKEIIIGTQEAYLELNEGAATLVADEVKIN